MSLFRPTCRPTEFDSDLSGQVLIPHAVNYLRRYPAESLDADTREALRRELAGWLAEYSRMTETLEAEDLKQYLARADDVLAKVNRALGRLEGRGETDDVESVVQAPRTLAS